MARRLVVALLVGAMGCASASQEPNDGPAPPGDGLNVEVEALMSGWVVHTNRPASVALFEIVPNRGAGLLYPDPNKDREGVVDGSLRVTGTGGVILRHRSAYAAKVGGGGLVGSQNLDLMAANTPTLVFAVACECDLNLAGLERPDGPVDLLGPFASLDAQTAARKLVEAVLPSADVIYTTSRYFGTQ